MLKAICIIVLITCVGTMIYSIINAIKINKENKAKDEENARIFMAKNMMDNTSSNHIEYDTQDIDITNSMAEQSQSDKSESGHNESECDIDFTKQHEKVLQKFFQT